MGVLGLKARPWIVLNFFTPYPLAHADESIR